MVSKGNLPKLSQIPQPLEFQSFRCHWNPFFPPLGQWRLNLNISGNKEANKGGSFIPRTQPHDHNQPHGRPLEEYAVLPFVQGNNDWGKLKGFSSEVKLTSWERRIWTQVCPSFYGITKLSPGSRNLVLIGFPVQPNDEETGLSRELSCGSQAGRRKYVTEDAQLWTPARNLLLKRSSGDPLF